MSAIAAAVETLLARQRAGLERGDEREDADVQHRHRHQELDQAEAGLLFTGAQKHTPGIGS